MEFEVVMNLFEGYTSQDWTSLGFIFGFGLIIAFIAIKIINFFEPAFNKVEKEVCDAFDDKDRSDIAPMQKFANRGIISGVILFFISCFLAISTIVIFSLFIIGASVVLRMIVKKKSKNSID